MILLNNARQYHITTPISARPPSEPLRYDLRLCVNQKRFDVSINGYWTAKLSRVQPYISHLLNEQPSFADLTRAKQELSALDPETREKLMSIWPSGDMTTENFMNPFILGEKDIRSFLRDNFAPGVKYNSKFVNSELDNFFGARVKIGYGSSGPTTLEQISLLHDESDVLTDHPDKEVAHIILQLDVIVVRR
ncbi:hypothetical protein POM88_018878 [Heracleum sosnowskyi]|uniref:Uncharacterized protein n=1 Tax=Heracleum sosnowskyi TaxID=360622 RepID=A0AAD8IV73_9APIA|nr:hypothetical protein POM88_018878 [Heracleum sosnowskyi]